ncbi:MAG: AAA family ATPase [Promethearchaeota archaeon]
MKLKRIEIKNFKSLKDCSIDLSNINIVIGPNGAGKSNFIEVFTLLKKIYADHNYNPFEEWWSYDNVVWNKDESLNINLKLYFDYYGYEIIFETEFSGKGGFFHFLKEVIEIKEILTITKVGSNFSLEYNDNFFKNTSKLQNKELKNKIRKFQEIVLPSFSQQYSILHFSYSSKDLIEKDNNVVISILNVSSHKNPIYLMTPIISKDNIKKDKESLSHIWRKLINFFQSPIINNIDFRALKEPFRASKVKVIDNSAKNLGNVIYNLFLEQNGIPELIQFFIEQIFPNQKISFELTQDGRILLKVKQGSEEFFSPSISQGFYKCLVLATLIELNPPIIIIDEIENSLYAKVLNLFIDIIRERKIQLIITTHSPYLIDIIDPKNIIIIKMTESGSLFSKIKNPQKIKEELNRLQVTLSEKWLFGMLE